MLDTPSRQFGLLIAYLLPGFIGLAGVAAIVPPVALWLRPLDATAPGVGASLYTLLSATTVGMIVSCFRWLVIDAIHHRSGVRQPQWNDARLDQRLEAFDYLVENHYRYYQFYANALVALLWAYPAQRVLQTSPLLGIGTDLGVLIICAALFAGSRDALAKYYQRTARLIGEVAEEGHDIMTNGNHVAEEAGASQDPRHSAKPQAAKAELPAKAQPTKPKTPGAK
jgi:hypothetical protein